MTKKVKCLVNKPTLLIKRLNIRIFSIVLIQGGDSRIQGLHLGSSKCPFLEKTCRPDSMGASL